MSSKLSSLTRERSLEEDLPYGAEDMAGEAKLSDSKENCTILPPTVDMLPEEGFAHREWGRQNAIRLEEKEKMEKEMLKEIIDEADEYIAEYKKWKIRCENSRASNREKDKRPKKPTGNQLLNLYQMKFRAIEKKGCVKHLSNSKHKTPPHMMLPPPELKPRKEAKTAEPAKSPTVSKPEVGKMTIYANYRPISAKSVVCRLPAPLKVSDQFEVYFEIFFWNMASTAVVPSGTEKMKYDAIVVDKLLIYFCCQDAVVLSGTERQNMR
ncbi:unnamed protein product [Fraxinus pennsylvanica]|uniref:Uncharacterized protein n=1 Tax=Fraxinus pennsylvanica TaxID=56036 RepID=A0AAD1YMJ5_9LAMI|nr:unnamed protein product [Fraxinus pennsylvanica]